jgi:hypothetical protein
VRTIIVEEHMRIVSAVCVAFIAAGAAAGAQQPRPSDDAVAAHKTFVLTGCLTSTGTAPTSAYKLVDASPVGQAPPAAAEGAVATSGKADTPDKKATYTLMPQTTIGESGVPEAQLKTYVGQRVQVTVRAAESAPPAPRGAAVVAPTRPEEATPLQLSVTEISRTNGECN